MGALPRRPNKRWSNLTGGAQQTLNTAGGGNAAGRLLFDQLRKFDTLDEVIDAVDALRRFDAQRIVLAFLILAAAQDRGEDGFERWQS